MRTFIPNIRNIDNYFVSEEEWKERIRGIESKNYIEIDKDYNANNNDFIILLNNIKITLPDGDKYYNIEILANNHRGIIEYNNRRIYLDPDEKITFIYIGKWVYYKNFINFL